MSQHHPALYDLHLHTFWSYDANAHIRPYFERARALGMRCIAITEHHNIDSAAEVAEVAAEFPEIQLIVAAELSVHTSIGSVDLLCYNLPSQPEGEFAEVLGEYNQWQRARGAAICQAMQALGFDYNEKELLKTLSATRPARAIERQGATHLPARHLHSAWLELGYATTPQEQADLAKRFKEVIKAPNYPAVQRVVTAVKAVGGTVVMAHPTVYVDGRDEMRLDALREECGLDGIECAHRRVPPELTLFYRDYCIKHNMVSTGGSDSHDQRDSNPYPGPWGHTTARRFGCHIGEAAWLDEFLERLDAQKRP